MGMGLTPSRFAIVLRTSRRPGASIAGKDLFVQCAIDAMGQRGLAVLLFAAGDDVRQILVIRRWSCLCSLCGRLAASTPPGSRRLVLACRLV